MNWGYSKLVVVADAALLDMLVPGDDRLLVGLVNKEIKERGLLLSVALLEKLLVWKIVRVGVGGQEEGIQVEEGILVATAAGGGPGGAGFGIGPRPQWAAPPPWQSSHCTSPLMLGLNAGE